MSKIDVFNSNIIKPILKWVGGKTQSIHKIVPHFPKTITNFHDVFVGGGSVLFALLHLHNEKIVNISGNIYAYDINEPLIYMYKNIQQFPKELYEEIQKIIIQFNTIKDIDILINRNPEKIEQALESKENYYYWIRKQYNNLSNEDKKNLIGSSMFIFLNKTCFRGVFRVGPNGFNVPYGNYKNPEIINYDHLIKIHNLIKNVIFQCIDFNISMKNIIDSDEDDFAYIDPPYVQETKTSFVKYTENGFNIEDHAVLFSIINNMTLKNKKMMLCNSNVPFVKDNFIMEKYTIIPIVCKRAINSKNPDAKATELIIINY